MFQAIRNGVRAFNLSRQDSKQSRAVLTSLEGVSGTQIMSGFITNEDSNRKFQELESGIKEYRQMKRVDPVIRGLLNAWKLPILRAEKRIEPASDDNEDLKIAEEIESNLFENDNFSYGQWLKNILYFFDFGFEVQEKQFELVDGKWRWKAWAHRRPETIWEWGVENSELNHIHQQAFDSTTQRWRTDIVIPQDKLFHIANEMEGENFQGESVLRSTYRSYFIKDTMIRFQAIQAEKCAIGVIHGTLRNSSKMDEMIKFLKSYRVHEEGYLADSEDDFKFDVLGGKDLFGVDLKPWIEFHNNEMVEALNAGFLQAAKGDSGIGAKAKQVADIDFFVLAVETGANFLEDIVNNGSFGMQHIRQIVDLNHKNVKKYPKWKIAKISQDDVELLLRAIKLAKDTGFIDKTTNADEKFIREKVGVPEREMEEEEERGAVAPPDIEEEELELEEA